MRSARYAGEHATDEQNLDQLLREAPAGSALAYVCALAYVDPVAGVERLFEGRCAGRLAPAPRGAGGFGYDPAFLPDDVEVVPAGLTMAELTDGAEGRDLPPRAGCAGACRVAAAARDERGASERPAETAYPYMPAISREAR